MIRVQMVSDGIPAYQNDFANEADAVRTAAEFASGCQKAEQVSKADNIVYYKIKGGYIRAFNLQA